MQQKAAHEDDDENYGEYTNASMREFGFGFGDDDDPDAIYDAVHRKRRVRFLFFKYAACCRIAQPSTPSRAEQVSVAVVPTGPGVVCRQNQQVCQLPLAASIALIDLVARMLIILPPLQR